jgi:hypothetical protein
VIIEIKDVTDRGVRDCTVYLLNVDVNVDEKDVMNTGRPSWASGGEERISLDTRTANSLRGGYLIPFIDASRHVKKGEIIGMS